MTDDRCGCNHLATQHVGECRECLCPEWHPDTRVVDTLVLDRWPLRLPEYRAYRKSGAWHEAARLSAMCHFIRPGDVLYEVGAEEGDYAALFTSWGCRTVLAEPNPKSWPSIRCSMEANGFRPAGWWVGFLTDREWRTDGEHRLGWGDWPDCASNPLTPEHGFQTEVEYSGQTPGMRLDTLALQLRLPPTVVSVDVEGAELKVLRGAERTLRVERPLVFVSIHPEFIRDTYGETAEQVHEFMRSVGYEATYLATDHEEHWLYQAPETARR